VKVERPSEADAFLAAAEPLLLCDEARHNLILGLAGTTRDAPGLYPRREFWVVRDGKRPVAAALRTPPHNLVLARPAEDGALEALAAAVTDELPGVIGAMPEAEAFAALWAERTGVEVRTTMRQGVYALTRVEPPPPVPGRARVAGAIDRELVLGWWVAFAEEALHEGAPEHDGAEAAVDHRLEAPTSGFLLWEDDGRPVSLAGWGGPTPNGVRVGPVYTPPELRGRGYATALTAELSRGLLEGGLFPGGRRFCFLYTDLANPTSNAIYERIGYRRVCESAEIAFR